MLGPQFDVGVDQSGEELVEEAGGFVGVHWFRLEGLKNPVRGNGPGKSN
jgi:hypothetical protein